MRGIAPSLVCLALLVCAPATRADAPVSAGAPPTAGAAPAAATPVPAPARPPRPFLFSVVGPGDGRGALGMGARVFFIIPTYDLNYVYGLVDGLDFQFRFGSLIAFDTLEFGLKGRLLGDEAMSLGLRGEIAAIGGIGGSAALFFIYAAPGLVFSFGSRAFQITLGADVPLLFIGGSGSASGGSDRGPWGDGVAAFRPSLAVEFPVGTETNMYLQGMVFLGPGEFVWPAAGLGASW